MKLEFDAHQDYQLAAVRAVADAFEGQPLAAAGGGSPAGTTGPAGAASTANSLLLSPEQLLTNVRRVQVRHGLPQSEALATTAYTLAGQPGTLPLNLTVEMETGTGKTYTYLRTIYELHQRYGFAKFVIVVPSVAIREGTLQSLALTHEHFQALYRRVPMRFGVYDSSRLTELRTFANSPALQVLVLNIDAFAREDTLINTRREAGQAPIEYVRQCRPVVIVDEPQNLETEARRAALARLHPLALLRYSATHRHLYDLVYSLNPVQAYDRGLVKQIVVDGITAEPDLNAALVGLRALVPGKLTLGARLAFYENGPAGGARPTEQVLHPGDDLFARSGGREAYREGFIVNEIDRAAGTVRLSGGRVLRLGETTGGEADALMREQVRQTVRHHFERVRQLGPRGIKVLSLFFVDRVASYRGAEAGASAAGGGVGTNTGTEASRPDRALGKLGRWLEAAYAELSARPEYTGLLPFAAGQVHAGYFSQDRQGRARDTSGSTRADDDAYQLIMRDKQRLLSLAEPVQFIFSHSALREGWDNPNVFQICTLQESRTPLRKRQEIGRGLRLPVDASGRRVRERALNVLTIIANESYEAFARALQAEIEEETSVSFAGRLQDARTLVTVRLAHALTPAGCPAFFELWDPLRIKTRYEILLDTAELIDQAVAELRDLGRVPPTTRPRLLSQVARLTLSQAGGVRATPAPAPRRAGAGAGAREEAEAAPEAGAISEQQAQPVAPVEASMEAPPEAYPLPDIYAYLQARLGLRRATLLAMLTQSGRLAELPLNPQLFLDNVAAAIERRLRPLLARHVRYERLAGQEQGQTHVLSLFETAERSASAAGLVALPEHPEKALYNYVAAGSARNQQFARDLVAHPAVRFFVRLPPAYLIPTPAGDYAPTWAVLLAAGGPASVLVIDTSAAAALEGAGPDTAAALRIQCARRHFELLAPAGVRFAVGTDVAQVLAQALGEAGEAN